MGYIIAAEVACIRLLSDQSSCFLLFFDRAVRFGAKFCLLIPISFILSLLFYYHTKITGFDGGLGLKAFSDYNTFFWLLAEGRDFLNDYFRLNCVGLEGGDEIRGIELKAF